jgi:membrane-bound serine protease (ClpP class)
MHDMTALGVVLLLIGAILVMAEAHVPSMGAVGGPGAIVMAIGAVLAVGALGGGLLLGLLAALGLGGAGLGLVAISVKKGAAVRSRRVRTGSEGLTGHIGVVRNWDATGGKVMLDGALWRAARSAYEDHDELELRPGDKVVVERLNGLELSVRRAEDWELVR